MHLPIKVRCFARCVKLPPVVRCRTAQHVLREVGALWASMLELQNFTIGGSVLHGRRQLASRGGYVPAARWWPCNPAITGRPTQPVARQDSGWEAAVTEVMNELSGGSFSVIALLETRGGDLGSHATAVDTVLSLGNAFSTSETTWVIHSESVGPYGAQLASLSDLCGNTVWTHRPLDDVTLTTLRTTPYMFDFMILPGDELKNLIRACLANSAGPACRKLETFASITKMIVPLPTTGSMGEIQFPSAAMNSGMNVSTSVRVGSNGVSLVLISVDRMERCTQHHFGGGRGKTLPPPHLYRLVYDKAAGWMPTLHVWKLRSPHGGSAVMEPTLRDDGSLIDLEGATYGRENRAIELSKLAMVNMELLNGLNPSLWTRLRLWELLLDLPINHDCNMPNTCLLGTRVVWCDSHFNMAETAKNPSIRDSRGPFRAKCFWVLHKILGGCATCARPRW